MNDISFIVYTITNEDESRFLYIDGWFIYQTTDNLRDATTFQNIVDARFMLSCAKEHLNNLGLVKVVPVYMMMGRLK